MSKVASESANIKIKALKSMLKVQEEKLISEMLNYKNLKSVLMQKKQNVHSYQNELINLKNTACAGRKIKMFIQYLEVKEKIKAEIYLVSATQNMIKESSLNIKWLKKQINTTNKNLNKLNVIDEEAKI